MKIGDIIQFGGRWGVISKYDGSRAIFRYQEYDIHNPLSHFRDCLAHDWFPITLTEWYTEYEPNPVKQIYYSIYEECEGMWDAITMDGESFIATCGVMFLFALLLGLLISVFSRAMVSV